MPIEIDAVVDLKDFKQVIDRASAALNPQAATAIARHAVVPLVKSLRTKVRNVEGMSARARRLAARTVGVSRRRGLKIGFVKKGDLTSGLSIRNVHWWILGTKEREGGRGRIKPYLAGLLDAAVSETQSEVLQRAKDKLLLMLRRAARL